MNRFFWLVLGLVTLAAVPRSEVAAMSTGTPDVQSAGPLAFGPEGILFIADPKGAAIFAIDTKDTQAGGKANAELALDGIDSQVAALLGTTADDILINDLAVNPASGAVYLSVERGRGPEATPVLIRIDGSGELKLVSLDNVAFSKAELANAPEDRVVGEGRRRGNQRMESITDLMFVDGRLYVAGLSNEEFASKLRSIQYPFDDQVADTSVEIYHGSHGQYETRSPVRTFTIYNIGDQPNLLAAYTCTPLVKIPLDSLVPGEKVQGQTVAELGNHNRPLDMVVYEKDGRDFLLMSNNARGLMKIALDDVASVDAITERVDDKAGLEYETIDAEPGVVQLDRLNSGHVVVLVQAGDERQNLRTIALP